MRGFAHALILGEERTSVCPKERREVEGIQCPQGNVGMQPVDNRRGFAREGMVKSHQADPAL